MPLMNIWACGYCCKMLSLCHYNHNIKQKKVELKLLRYLHVKLEYFPSSILSTTAFITRGP